MSRTIQTVGRGSLHGGIWLVLPLAAVLMTAGSAGVGKTGPSTRVLGQQFNAANGSTTTSNNPGHAITVTGTVLGNLVPGSSTKLRLLIANTNNQDVTLQSASATIGSPTTTSCLASWFTVGSYVGAPAITVKKNSSATLDLDFAMLNKPVNQDACKRATIPLAFRVTAAGA